MLEVKNLSFSYGGCRILNNISLMAENGEFVSVLIAYRHWQNVFFRAERIDGFFRAGELGAVHIADHQHTTAGETVPEKRQGRRRRVQVCVYGYKGKAPLSEALPTVMQESSPIWAHNYLKNTKDRNQSLRDVRPWPQSARHRKIRLFS